MKRILLSAALAALLLAGCGQEVPGETVPTEPPYLTIAGETYPRDAETLDLRETAITAEEYEQLCREYPDRQILWKVPFQGLRLDVSTRQLRLEAITSQDLENLTYLPNLRSIHGKTCPEQAVLDALAELVPGCHVTYDVALGGQTLAWDTRTLTMESGDLPQALEVLAFLPKLQEVTVSDVLTQTDTMLALIAAYPQVTFHCTFPFFGQEVSSDAVEVEVNKVTIASVEEVERLLPLFSNLEKLALLQTGLPSEELDALWKRHPETRIVWTIKMAWATVRTDVTTMMPFKYGYDGYYPELRLGDGAMAEFKYLVDVVCMDLGHHNLTSIEFVRYMPNLKYLIIADTNVSDLTPLEDAKNLVYLEAFMDGVEDISALAGCTSLIDVNLCYNRISDITPLLGLEHLENIWLSSNIQIPKEQWELLRETFPEAKIVTYTESSTGMGWRNIPRYYEQRDLLGMGYMVG